MLARIRLRTAQNVPYGRLQLVHRRHFSLEPIWVVNTLTESVQWAHAHTGIPWWALIPLTTFTLRSVWTFPLALMQRFRVQRQNELRPIVSATHPVLKLNLAKRVQTARVQAEKSLEKIASSGQNEPAAADVVEALSPLAAMKYEEILLMATKETRKRQKLLFKKHNAQLWKNFILPVFQIPLWVCMSLTMRNLSGWSTWDSLSNKPLDASLYQEGLLWFTDLTVADSLHVFPLVLGVISLCNVEWTFKTFEMFNPSSKRKLFRPTVTDAVGNMSRMSVVFMMAVSLNAPVALTLYWLSSQVFSLVQNVFLDLVVPLNYSPERRVAYKKLKSPGALSVIKE